MKKPIVILLLVAVGGFSIYGFFRWREKNLGPDQVVLRSFGYLKAGNLSGLLATWVCLSCAIRAKWTTYGSPR